jgi:hypothetical protein
MIGMRQTPAAERRTDAQILVSAFQHVGSEGQFGHGRVFRGRTITHQPKRRRATGRRGPKNSRNPRFCWVFPCYPCTETNVTRSAQNPGSRREIRPKSQARTPRPGHVIKELGHAVPLAKALVEGASISWKGPHAPLPPLEAVSAQIKGTVVGRRGAAPNRGPSPSSPASRRTWNPCGNRKFHAQFPPADAVSFWLPVPRA